MRKLDVLKRPLNVLFCYSNKAIARGYARYFENEIVPESDEEETVSDERETGGGRKRNRAKLVVYGTNSNYRAKTWLALSNLSGITGPIRPRFLRDEKFKPLNTPYPFDVLVVEYIDRVPEASGSRELTTLELLETCNALGLLNGFLIEREGKEIYRPPLAIVVVLDPRDETPAVLRDLMREGVRGVIAKPLSEEEFKRAVLEAYNDVHVGTTARLKDGYEFEYERKEGTRESVTMVSDSLVANNVEIDTDFQGAGFQVVKSLL